MNKLRVQCLVTIVCFNSEVIRVPEKLFVQLNNQDQKIYVCLYYTHNCLYYIASLNLIILCRQHTKPLMVVKGSLGISKVLHGIMKYRMNEQRNMVEQFRRGETSDWLQLAQQPLLVLPILRL